MRLAQIHVILALAIVVSCQEPATHDETVTDATVNRDKQVEDNDDAEKTMRTDEDSDTLKVQDPLDPKNSELSILPPLILLDFGDDADNSTSGEEKSKRTIDNNLGYGFARNNLFTGKSNYYFPAGKSGTTVSIEESISPFLPKTIIENVKPISEKPYPGDQNKGYGQNPLDKTNFPGGSVRQSSSQTSLLNSNNQVPAVSYPQFGQRTKLYKPSQTDYNGYQTFSSTPKTPIVSYTTSRPEYRPNSVPASQNIFVTPKPGFPSSSFNSGFLPDTHTTRRPFVSYSTTAAPSYVTPTSSSHQARYTANPVDSFATPSPTFDGSTTARPSNPNSLTYSSDSPFAAFANLPRYTIENGVRYENKIVWKYSDGKISQTPPTSYINAYNEFLSKQNPGAGPPASTYQNFGSSSFNSGSIGSFRESGAGVNYPSYSSQASFQNPNFPSQSISYQSPQETRFPAESLGNIHSKSPAQFPNDQEPSKPARPSQFVSSASLQSANFGIESKAPQTPAVQRGQSYELAYQGQYGLKTSLRSSSAQSSSGASSYAEASRGNTKLLKDSYGSSYEEAERLTPKYAVNSPNPEYTYTTESSVVSTTPDSSNLFTPSGTLSPNVLSKYSTQAQKYLTKVFTPGKKNTIEDYQPVSPSSSGQQSYGNSYINTNYENLLNYNPSISQYIRNPSSILKAQPTYIQAGNSLIPVIILRVDGAPPIQSKTTPNINLKALLQQYLTQYADSIGQNGNNFADSRPYEKTRSAQQSPIHDLTQLTQTLSRYSQDPSISNNFAKQYQGNVNQNPYDTSFQSRMNYHGLDKTNPSNNYGSRTNKPQKIKSVQIIDDPRFTSYKVNR